MGSWAAAIEKLAVLANNIFFRKSAKLQRFEDWAKKGRKKHLEAVKKGRPQ